MGDYSGPPRRVSMSYILGFSNKPYKDPKPPPLSQRPPHVSLREVLSSPRGLTEWTASDGRKGALTGPGKARSSGDRNRRASSEKGEKQSKGDWKKDDAKEKDEDDDAKEKDEDNDGEADDGDNPHGFTKEQDKKLLAYKTENPSGPWQQIADELGQEKYKCQERFKQLNSKGGDQGGGKNQGGGGGGGVDQQKQGKKNKNKGQNKNQGQNQNSGNKGNKQQQVSGGDQTNQCANNDTKGNAETGGADDVFGGLDLFANDEDKKDSGDGANNNAGGAAWDNTGAAWGGGDNSGGNVGQNETWGDNNNASGDAGWNNTSGDAPGGSGDASGGWNNDTSGRNKNQNWDADNGGGGSYKAPSSRKSSASNKVGADPWAFGGNDNIGGDGGWGDMTNNQNKTGGGDWAATNDTQNNDTSGPTAWNADPNTGGKNWDAQQPAKSASKPPSHRASSHKSKSHHHGHSNTDVAVHRVELEVKPDSTFSADDLRLVARILQQDYQMVWNRVSWRFRDKTGRTVPAEVFERKITGRVEGKNGDGGRERERKKR